MACMNNIEQKLKVVFGDVTLGVQSMTGKEFRCIFSYAAGGMESLQVEGKEWVYRVPRPTFWRATTDNDLGNIAHKQIGKLHRILNRISLLRS